MQEHWLTALRAPGLGGKRLSELLTEFGSVSELVRATPSQLRKAGLGDETVAALQSPDRSLLEQDSCWLAQEEHHLVAIDSHDYPELLKRISGAPPALWVSGDPGLLWQPQIAIVGSRNPTAAGMDHARAFSGELAGQGFAITSGLAAGIDVCAHEAALEVPDGKTIAVLGTGPDVQYPARNAGAFEAITQRGALVTEFPPGTGAKAWHFPSRNRIISGLALGVLVVEAGVQSGSLITARLAGEQGREVFALPGSLHNPLARGCHRLIKQGALLAESTRDIISHLAPMVEELARAIDSINVTESKQPRRPVQADDGIPDDPDYQKLWTALSFDPEPVDRVIERSGLSAREVSSMLLMLELEGRVLFHAGGRVCRQKKGT